MTAVAQDLSPTDLDRKTVKPASDIPVFFFFFFTKSEADGLGAAQPSE